jgi:hypothetical protein
MMCAICTAPSGDYREVRVRAGISMRMMADGLGSSFGPMSHAERGDLLPMRIESIHAWHRVIALIRRHLEIPESACDESGVAA